MTAEKMHPDEKRYCDYTTCTNIARYHVRLYDGYETMDCWDHFRRFDQRELDFHEIGHACGLPGATWYTAPIVGKGYCSFDWGNGMKQLIESEAVPA